MTNHSLDIQGIVLRNISKISTFRNLFKSLFCLFRYVHMFVVGMNLFNIFKGISNSDIWFLSTRSVRRSGMDKIETSIKTNSYKQHTLSILRNTIFSKIVQLHFYHVTRTNLAKIFDDLLDRASVICSQQSFNIFSNKCLWLFCSNKSKKVFIQTTSVAIQTGLFPNNREILARESSDDQIAIRNTLVCIWLYLFNIF